MGLPYPGGPHVDRLAQQGNPEFMTFGRSQVDGFNFSFSGMKTSFLYNLQKRVKAEPDFLKHHLADVCASYQHALLDVLFKKLELAIRTHNVKHVAIAGGVSANSGLRARLKKLGTEKRLNVYIPPFEYTTDNAAMIGIAGYYNYLAGEQSDLSVAAAAKVKF